MTHILVKSGRVIVQGGRVLTSQGGAPCCCDGGTACDIASSVQIRFNQLQFTLETTYEQVTEASGSAPELRTNRRTTWDITFPGDTLIRFGRASVNPPVSDIRERDIGDQATPTALRADCSGLEIGQYNPSSWRPSRFNFYPTGTITNVRRVESWNPFSGFQVTETIETTEVFGLYAAYLRNLSVVDDASITSLVFSFIGCYTQTRDGQVIVSNRDVRTPYMEMHFEDSDPAQLSEFGAEPMRWQDIPIRSSLGSGCGPFAWSESNLSGRRYINDGDSTGTERQVLFSFDQDYPEYFNSGSDDYAVIPRPFVTAGTSGGGVPRVTTYDHTATLAASGTIEEHDFADEPNGFGCGDEFVYDCGNRPPSGGGGGGNPGGPTQGPGGTDAGGGVTPSGNNQFTAPQDPALQAELARQAQMRTGQFPGRCPSCGG